MPAYGYWVTTWDADKQRFTAQKGVRSGPWSKWGLCRALRRLANLGYDIHREGAHSVLVERREIVERVTKGSGNWQGA